MKPTRKVNPFDEETDWDGLYLAIEKAVDKICEHHDHDAVVWALSGLVWRNLREFAPYGSPEINALESIRILSDWDEVDSTKTPKIEPLLEAISRIQDPRRQAVVVLSHIQALARFSGAEFTPDYRDIYKRDVRRTGQDKPLRRR
jgi:hypothetical protein